MTVKLVTSTLTRWLRMPVPCASTTPTCVQCPAGGGLHTQRLALQEHEPCRLTSRPEKPVPASAFVFDFFRRNKSKINASLAPVKLVTSKLTRWPRRPVPCASTKPACRPCPAGGGLHTRWPALQEHESYRLTSRPEKPVSDSVSDPASVLNFFRRNKLSTPSTYMNLQNSYRHAPCARNATFFTFFPECAV